MRLWTAMLGAWLAAGTGTATGDPASGQGARQAGGLSPRLMAEHVIDRAAASRTQAQGRAAGPTAEKDGPEQG